MILERAKERRNVLESQRAKGQAVIQYLTMLQREERGRSNLLRAKGHMLAVSTSVQTDLTALPCTHPVNIIPFSVRVSCVPYAPVA